MHENSSLQERIKVIKIKQTQKTLSKLISYYKTNKITKDEFITKLSKFQEIVQELEKEFVLLNKIIEKRKNINGFNFFILEHLWFNGLEKTAAHFKNKYFCEEERVYADDSEFYNKLNEYAKEIEAGVCTNVLAFLKSNKMLLKEDYDLLEGKISLVEFIRLSDKEPKKAMQYARDKFTKGESKLRNHLMNLLSENKERFNSEVTNKIINETKKLFFDTIFNLYNLEDRLQKRISYGLIAYSTPNCDRNIECPGCAYKSFSVMLNRSENSTILCEGDRILLDESNMAYADEKGKVFGRKHLEHSSKEITEPKICYFV